MKNSRNNSFFKELFESVKNFDKYQDFAVEKTSKTILYVLKVVAIFTFVIALAFTYKMHIEKNKLVTYLNENISDIKFENNKLSINSNEKLVLENKILDDTKLIIDTKELSEEDIKKYEEEINGYSNGCVILNDKMIIKTEINDTHNTYLYEEVFKKYNVTSFNKKDIIEGLSGKEITTFYVMFFVIFYIYMFIIYIMTILMYAVMLALLGRITSMLLRMPLKYKATFNMAIHALTLPIILNLIYIVINLFTGFTIKYFQVMYSTISYIYIVTAILIIKTDFIKRQLELSKILEEQQKIRDNYNDGNSEEKDISNNQDKEDKKENKDDKEEKTKEQKQTQEQEPDNG